jgi:hypothetical protein
MKKIIRTATEIRAKLKQIRKISETATFRIPKFCNSTAPRNIRIVRKIKPLKYFR